MDGFNVVRTRSGDQLHTQFAPDGHGYTRTQCGCRIATLISGPIKRRPNLFCVKCFGDKIDETRERWNAALLNAEII
jgi:hypothetical protein